MSDLRSSNAPLPMIRKKGERRRPLLSTFVGNNRQMLQEISDSLSHLRKQPTGEGRHDNPLQASHRDLSQSTPNLLEKLNGKQSTSNRLDYHKKALDKIRQDLEPFHNSDQASTCSDGTGSMCNGLEPDVRTDSHMLQRLLLMGYEEEVVNQALRLCNNKSVEAAVEAIHKLAQLEGKNGYSKGLTTHGNKVIRKPSFEEKYRQGSPISDCASVRSDSPSVNCSRTFDPRQFLGNQPMLSVPGLSVFAEERQTPPPPPLPPRGVPPGHATKGPSPAPPGYMQVGQNGKQHATEQNIVVQQTMRRMSPGQKEYSTLLPQNGQYLNGSNDFGTPQKGTNPMVPPRQPQSSICSSQNHVPNIITHTRTLHNGSNSSSASDNTTVSTPSGRISMTLVQPPPYSKSLSLGKAGPPQQMEATSSVATQMADFHLTDELPSSGSSPLASHSPSPAPSQTHGQVYNTSHQSSPGPYGSGSWPQPPVPMSAWGARQQPIIMGAVKSREVQKPVLQTATAPVSPQVQGNTSQQNYVSSVQAQVNMPPSPQLNPQQFSVNSGQFQIEIMQPSQQVQPQMLAPAPPSSHSNLNTYPHGGSHSGRKIQIHIQNQGPHTVNVQQYGPGAQNYLPAYTSASPEHYYHPAFHHGLSVDTPGSTPRSNSPVPRTLNQSPLSVISNTSSPSSNSDIPDKPPPPYSGRHITAQGQIIIQPKPDPVPPQTQPPPDLAAQELVDGPDETDFELESCDNVEEESEIIENDQSTGTMVIRSGNKILCASPKPERKPEAKKKDAERREFKVKNYSPQAYKFFMEQHVENLLKSHRLRINRRLQLEREMSKVKLPEEAQTQMRKMLHQKESNYIRLKRARMHKCLFHQIKTLGIGAFGEVALVRKGETNQLYAMKTLRKHDVLQRNQVAHVKAERDILAEADNEWVVKLYYSFQDKENLYFVMEYIPGGDMMGLLIKYGIFPESLAQFYIAELVLAIESVHKMGFIHRDIKPDNILIDKDGHIKLTDFGLCTGFRWTHNSKYYQKGNHARQDSMEPDESWSMDCNCPPKSLKPLERRKIRDHQRCLAHSLVGTPNYIAPEVLQRSGYTNSCDWWSVGVILYEMRVGQPPFLANTPAETQAKVIHWHETLNIPREARLTQSTTDLILSLCCGAEHRLGHNGADDIKKHPFFSSLTWDGLRQQNAPYIPKIMHATDTSNFDPVDPEKIRNSQSTSGVDFDLVGMYENGKHPEHAFFEFTFRRFFDDGGHPYATRMTDPEADSPVYV